MRRVMMLMLMISASLLPHAVSAEAPLPDKVKRDMIAFVVERFANQRIPPKNLMLCFAYTNAAITEIWQSDFTPRVIDRHSAALRSVGCLTEHSKLVLASRILPRTSQDAPSYEANIDRSLDMRVIQTPTLMVPYVRLSSFGEDTSGLIHATVQSYVGQYGKLPYYMIVDVRENPGGLLSEAVSALSLFAPRAEELLFTTVPRVGKITEHKAPAGPYASIPVGVLVDGKTASAAEIFAGVMQGWGKVIIGQRTFGKGVYQNSYPIGPLKLVITEGEIILPGGRSYNGRGIDPDSGMQVSNASPNLDSKKDQALLKALEGLRTPSR